MVERVFIVVRGIVQGVGFRPFVYNLAVNNNLKGWVNNTSKGVFIDLEGEREEIDTFIHGLKNNPPPLAKIVSIHIENKDVANFNSFEITFSEEENDVSTLISPDMATCSECRDDILNKDNRRYKYPFTNCTNCGPRFSIIKKLPYDRPVTTMAKFEMCEECLREYKDPSNRRFHAQPNACPICGPKIWIMDNNGKEHHCEDILDETQKLLLKGKLFAIKGLGGFHLVCDGTNKEAISELRKRKNRPMKPLAVMMRDIATVKKYCDVSEKEEEVLCSNRAPIVILDKKENNSLPNNLTMVNDTLGVMIPYTPLHHLLFNENIDVLVMTSANISGEPMIYKNEEAREGLSNIVDYFLLHDRDIYLPVDDSVSRVILGEERLIRPGRGYGPISVDITNSEDILACGSHLKNTFSISNATNVFISQYIGDMDNYKTYGTFEGNLEHFKNIYKIEPKIIAYDYHPDYWSRDLVNNFEGEKLPAQHHHSHIVSCMVENHTNDPVIGIAFDGTGYGDDGHIWGGEFFICNRKEYTRVGHLNYVPLPGGDSAVKELWKSSIGHLYHSFGDEYKLNIPKTLDLDRVNLIVSMIKKNINSPLTSSMGRLFDGVAGLLGFNKKITFEAEGAIYLENIADKIETGSYSYEIDQEDDKNIINTKKLIQGILEDLKNDISISIISKKFHNTITIFTVDFAVRLREKYNIDEVALSGGVFNNELLFKSIVMELEKREFIVHTHKNIPCNDSGVSLGQLIIASENIKGRD